MNSFTVRAIVEFEDLFVVFICLFVLFFTFTLIPNLIQIFFKYSLLHPEETRLRMGEVL